MIEISATSSRNEAYERSRQTLNINISNNMWRKSTYSFRVPLQICRPLGEIPCHAQHLGVACRREERVAQHQRHQRRHKQQVVKDRHDSLTPTALTEPFVCLCVANADMQPRMLVVDIF